MRCSQYDVLSINLLWNQKLYNKNYILFIKSFYIIYVYFFILLWCFMFLTISVEVRAAQRSQRPAWARRLRARQAGSRLYIRTTLWQRCDNVVTTQRYKATLQRCYNVVTTFPLHVTRCHKSLVSLYLAKLTEAAKSCSSTKSLAPPLKTCDRNSRNKWNKYKRITSDRVR